MTDATPSSGSAPDPATESGDPTPETPAAITRPSLRGLLIADFVSSPGDGKIYVNGGFFSLLRFPSFPAILPTLGLAAVVEVPFHDTYKEHSIVFTLRGPNNEELPLRIEARFRSTATHDAVFGEPHLVPLAANVVNIEFRQPGSYNLVLSFDGKELGRYALRATQDVTATIGR